VPRLLNQTGMGQACQSSSDRIARPAPSTAVDFIEFIVPAPFGLDETGFDL